MSTLKDKTKNELIEKNEVLEKQVKYLEKNEDKYRELTSMLPQIVYETDIQGNLTFVNKQAFDFFGYTKEDFDNGVNSLQTLIPEDRDRAKENMQNILNRNNIVNSEYTALRKDGKTFPIIIYSNPIIKDNKPVGLRGIIFDITEQKKTEEALREKEAYSRAIFEQSPISIQIFDKTGLTVNTNKAYGELWQLPTDEIIGKYNILEDEYARESEWFNIIEKAFKGETNVIPELEYDPAKSGNPGRKRTLKCVISPIKNKNGEVDRVILMHEDITERKQAEEELEKHHKHLEKMIQERTAELEIKNKGLIKSQKAMSFLTEDMNESSEKLRISNEQFEIVNKELEAFSYSVSHDLRAPLRAINGFTHILMEDYVANLDAEGKRVGLIIQHNAKKMGQLIDDLLAFSRMGRTTMSFSEIDMKNMVNAIYHEVANEKERKRITFTIADLSGAEGDTNMMRQVWINFISNAIKYSANRKQAVISVSCQEEENKLTYCIKDNGVGFNMKYKDKLFRVFQRLHNENEFEGTGVGLAVAQRIINRHGGEIWANGELDNGATFYFSLPKKKFKVEN